MNNIINIGKKITNTGRPQMSVVIRSISKRSDNTVYRRFDIQHNDIQYNDIQHNDIQYNDIQHNDIQYNDIQHNDTQHNDTQHNLLNCETYHK